MACLRAEAIEGQSRTLRCPEEGCKFELLKDRRSPDFDAEAPPADCLLQLRLRARAAEDYDAVLAGVIYKPKDEWLKELENDITAEERREAWIMANPFTCQHNLFTAGVNVDTFEQFFVCVSCDRHLDKAWIDKRGPGSYEFDIDNNVWVYNPNAKPMDRTRARAIDQVAEQLGFKVHSAIEDWIHTTAINAVDKMERLGSIYKITEDDFGVTFHIQWKNGLDTE